MSKNKRNVTVIISVRELRFVWKTPSVSYMTQTMLR